MKRKDRKQIDVHMKQLIMLNNSLYRYYHMVDDIYCFVDDYYIITTIQKIRFTANEILKIYKKYAKEKLPENILKLLREI